MSRKMFIFKNSFLSLLSSHSSNRLNPSSLVRTVFTWQGLNVLERIKTSMIYQWLMVSDFQCKMHCSRNVISCYFDLFPPLHGSTGMQRFGDAWSQLLDSQRIDDKSHLEEIYIVKFTECYRFWLLCAKYCMYYRLLCVLEDHENTF